MKKILILAVMMVFVSVVSAQTIHDNYRIVEISDDAYLEVTPGTSQTSSGILILTTTKRMVIPAEKWLQGFSRDKDHCKVIEAGLIPAGEVLVPYAVIDGKYILGKPIPPNAAFNGAAFDDEGHLVPCIVKDYGSHAVGYLSAEGELLDYWPNI